MHLNQGIVNLSNPQFRRWTSDIGHQISISHRFGFRFRISQRQSLPQPRVSFSCLRSIVILSESQI
jgi:hypothetical protein